MGHFEVDIIGHDNSAKALGYAGKSQDHLTTR